MTIQNGNATTAHLGGGKELKKDRQEINIISQMPEQVQKTCLAGTKFLDIEYCMANRGRFVSYLEHRKIDYTNAAHELANLDWTFLKNGISFIDNKNASSVFFRRTELDSWYVQTSAHDIYGNFWTAILDSEYAFLVLRLFFGESRWFEAVSWHLEPDLFEAYG